MDISQYLNSNTRTAIVAGTGFGAGVVANLFHYITNDSHDPQPTPNVVSTSVGGAIGADIGTESVEYLQHMQNDMFGAQDYVAMGAGIYSGMRAVDKILGGETPEYDTTE